MELFTCHRHVGSLRLTTAACAKNWQRAKHAQPWDALRPCQGCPVGAAHAGAPVPPPQVAAPNRHYCVRCNQYASRLLTDGVCVSCKNREYELNKGRDRRGKPVHPVTLFWVLTNPSKRKTLDLYPVSVGAVVANGHSEIVRAKAATTLEVMLKALRQDHYTRFFRAPCLGCLSGPQDLLPQLEIHSL